MFAFSFLVSYGFVHIRFPIYTARIEHFCALQYIISRFRVDFLQATRWDIVLVTVNVALITSTVVHASSSDGGNLLSQSICGSVRTGSVYMTVQ